MTTRITINPAGHTVEVAVTEGVPDDNTVTTEVLSPNTPPRDFWIHSTRSIAIREVPPDGH